MECLAPQVSACWFNFYREKKEVEMLCLCSLAFDYIKSLPLVRNASSSGYVIEQEGRKSEVVSLKKDDQINFFHLLKIHRKVFEKEAFHFKKIMKWS